MSTDPFASSLISQILTWFVSVPLLIYILSIGIAFLFEKQEGLPRIYTIWLLLCLLLLSPLRYILLQLLMAEAFPFQSWVAFFTTFILAIYIPIVFGILYFIGLGLPLFFIVLIAGFKTPNSKIRLILSGIAAPIIFLLFSSIYYNILPFAAKSTHWLGPYEVIRTTNGPSQYFYRYAVEQFTPLQFPGFTHDIGLDKMTAKERLRAHLAAVYCGNKQHWYYVSKVYPGYYEEFRRQHESNQQDK